MTSADYSIGYTQMYEMLDNDEDTDLWLLTEQGDTVIVPYSGEEALAEYMNPNSWPRFICKSLTVNQLEQGLGPVAALTLVNDTIANIIVPRHMPVAAKFGRYLGNMIASRSEGAKNAI